MSFVNDFKKKYSKYSKKLKKAAILFFLLIISIILFFWVINPIINLNSIFFFKDEKFNITPETTEKNNHKVDDIVYDDIVNEYCDSKKYLPQIEKIANFKIKNEREKAKQQSLENKTNFDDEWKVILSSYDVKNDKELIEKIKNDIKKTYFYDDFFNKKDGGFLNLDFFSKIYNEEALPYHIKEIFINVKDINNENVKLTYDEANKICNVINVLATDSFETASYLFNENNNLKQKNADRIVDVFSEDIEKNVKIATFLFDYKQNEKEKKKFVLSFDENYKYYFCKPLEEYIEKIVKYGFHQISIDEILLLKKREINDDYRNVIFNYLFSNNVNIITSKKLNDNYSSFCYNYLFKEFVLHSKENPILVVRGNRGLHFITVVKCPTNDMNYMRYFTPYMLNEKKYPTNENEEKIKTYIKNSVIDDNKIMLNKSNEIKKLIKKCCHFLKYYRLNKNDLENRKSLAKRLKIKIPEKYGERYITKIDDNNFLYYEKNDLVDKKCEILKNEFKNYYFDLAKKIKNKTKFRKDFLDLKNRGIL